MDSFNAEIIILHCTQHDQFIPWTKMLTSNRSIRVWNIWQVWVRAHAYWWRYWSWAWSRCWRRSKLFVRRRHPSSGDCNGISPLQATARRCSFGFRPSMKTATSRCSRWLWMLGSHFIQSNVSICNEKNNEWAMNINSISLPREVRRLTSEVWIFRFLTNYAV